MTDELPGKSIASLLGRPEGGLPAGPAQRLSESPLWERQRRFYSGSAAGIWGTATVPHSITCNPRIANTYARVVVEFLRTAGHDARGGGDAPHLVEYGGGSGRFAYLLVSALRELAPDLRFTYVLTDFAPERVAAWAEHPSFRPLVEEGFLDFAELDADRPGPLELLVTGRTLAPGSLTGPVVGIANYVFDTLRHDCFAIREGELLETLVAVPEESPADADPGPVTGMEWRTAPCGPLRPDLAPLLQEYAETLDDTTVLVPVGGLDCLSHAAGLTSGPTCALVADKGHCSPVDLCSHQAPSVVFHGSGFSVMVNFDLLARWVRSRGGVAVLPQEPARSLVVGVFVEGVPGPAGDRFGAFVRDQLLDTGPDNFFLLRPLLGGAGGPGLDTMLASLRLSRFDPMLLVEQLPGLLEALPAADDAVRSEVGRVLRRVWDHWFPIGEPVDMALCVGLAFSAMERYADAVDFLELSVKEYPESAPAAFAMAVARRGLRDLSAAQEWVGRALELEPGFSEARALRAVLAEEVG